MKGDWKNWLCFLIIVFFNRTMAQNSSVFLFSEEGDKPKIIVDNLNKLHLCWENGSQIYYSKINSIGSKLVENIQISEGAINTDLHFSKNSIQVLVVWKSLTLADIA